MRLSSQVARDAIIRAMAKGAESPVCPPRKERAGGCTQRAERGAVSQIEGEGQ